MSNLIVFFQYSFYMLVGFNLRVECESLVKIYDEKCSARLAREWTILERPREKYMLKAK